MRIDIKIIPNKDNKLLSFLPIFNAINQQNMCKIVEDWYCIVQSDVILYANSREESFFNAFQQDSYSKGIRFNCYILTKND